MLGKREKDKMNGNESFRNSTCAEQIQIAEAELSAFMLAVAECYGAEQARLAAEDWLQESEFMDGRARSTRRAWRAVTIAASARLANRLEVGRRHGNPHVAPSNTNESPIPASDSLAVTLPV
jgi:hypothetical protein